MATSVARSSARPVAGRRFPAALPGARMAAKTAPRGARAIVQAPVTGTIEDIKRHKRALVVTYKQDGTPVPTPVWAAEADGRLYVRTERAAGKVKRLRRDTRVLIAPCTVRGRPLGAPMHARGRVLEGELELVAERALQARYGLGRAIFERSVDALRIDMCYLEIAPASWSGDLEMDAADANDGGAISR
jgi:hypothetical protein